MKQLILGSLVAAIATFIWGAIFWMNPLPYSVAPRPQDEAQLGARLREQLSSSGTYLLPHPNNEPETLEKLSMAGPIATIHFRDAGRPVMEARVLIVGFVHGFASTLLIAILMAIALPSLTTYGSRARFATFVGLAIAVFVHLGDVIWMQHPAAWQNVRALYTLSFCIITGLVLGAFIKPAAASQRVESSSESRAATS